MKQCHAAVATLLMIVASLAAAKELAVVEEHRLRREAAALNLSCALPMQQGSCQVNAKHPCAPLGKGCVRPCGLFHVHMRGTGGKFYGENLINHLFEHMEMSLEMSFIETSTRDPFL